MIYVVNLGIIRTRRKITGDDLFSNRDGDVAGSCSNSMVREHSNQSCPYDDFVTGSMEQAQKPRTNEHNREKCSADGYPPLDRFPHLT